MTEWFETFFDDLWLLRSGDRRAEADFIRKALRLRKGQRVLDAPCGDGGVAIYLARRGLRVTGVDRMPKFIARARRCLAKEILPGEIRVLDLRRLEYEGQFEAAYNWFGSFAYFSNAENFDVLARLGRALRRGGRLLVDQPNREFILRHFRPRDVRAGAAVTARWVPQTQRFDDVWTVSGGGKRRSCRSSIRLYTPGQFRRLFERAGLQVTAMYGSRDGGEWCRSSRRLILVGRKGPA